MGKVGRPPRALQDTLRRLEEDFLKTGKPGERLPAETILARRYGVNRHTLRAAFSWWEKELRLVRRRSGGTYIAPSPATAWRAYLGKTVAVFFPSVTWTRDPFVLEMLAGVNEEIHHSGVTLAYSTRDWRFADPLLTPAAHFDAPHVLGALLLCRQRPGVLESVLSLSKPTVAADFSVAAPGLDSVVFDDLAAGELLARKLISSGHRRVVLLGEAPDKPPALADAAWAERRRGLLAGLRAGDVRVAELALVNRNPKLDDPQAFRDLLRRPSAERPTAVYMPLDASAEIYALAAELRLKIPRDLTLLACGDAKMDPKLTGVRFDARRLGAAAIHLLLDRVRDPKWKTRRATTRRLPGRYAAGRTHARAPR